MYPQIKFWDVPAVLLGTLVVLFAVAAVLLVATDGNRALNGG